MRMTWCGVAMLATVLVMAGGCQTHHPTARNVLGSITGQVEAPAGVVTQIARETLEQDLELEIITFRSEDGRGMVLARAEGNRQVQIDINADGERHSQVRVRVGARGDTDASLAILNRIKRNAENR